jgi:predicted XRE-type DNA-binding protein
VSDCEFEQFDNVWDALCDTPEEAANLTARSDLMVQIERWIKAEGWTEAEAGRRAGLMESRIHDLMQGKIDEFSLDSLVSIAALLGRKVRMELEAA